MTDKPVTAESERERAEFPCPWHRKSCAPHCHLCVDIEAYRREGVREALLEAAELVRQSQCETWCAVCQCRAADCGCPVPPYRRHGIELAKRIAELEGADQ